MGCAVYVQKAIFQPFWQESFCSENSVAIHYDTASTYSLITQLPPKSMKVISIAPGHNATLAYFENGRCISVLHEEKFSNIKNHVGFPERALAHLLRQHSVTEIDKFVFTTNQQFTLNVPGSATDRLAGQVESTSQGPLRRVFNWLEYRTGFKLLFSGIRNTLLNHFVSPKAWGKTIQWLESTYGIPRSKVVSIDHHLCHALTPVFFFGLSQTHEKSLLITVDGAGDNASSKIFIFDPLCGYQQIACTSFDSSIGLVYAEATKFLGMKVNEHEYKVMGLAAYVPEEKYYGAVYRKLRSIIWLDRDKLAFRSKFNTNVSRLFYRDNFPYVRFDNIAAATQKLAEDVVIELIQAAVEETGIRRVALSGGVFMNVKMNQRISALPYIDKLYFQPSCGDESLVIGGACKTYLDAKIPLTPINSMYHGQAYTNAEVEKYLRSQGCFDKYRIEFVEDIESRIALLLSQYQIVARFNGACEWGARSLCNRGILGNASDLKTFFEVNDMIKMRDFWMPFAPTILAEWCAEYIRNWDTLAPKIGESAKYMIITVDSTPLAQLHLRAAIHQKDKTLRPQIVEQVDNPKLHALLKKYEELTGMGGVMNTSLNIHGYPLVSTLDQAIFTLENSGLKYLALENWLVSKIESGDGAPSAQ